MPRTFSIPMLLASAASIFAVGSATPASAGTFDVRSCSANPIATPPALLTGADDAWTFETNDPGHLEGTRNCPPVHDTNIDGLVVQDRLMTSDSALGTFAQWRFEAPPDTSLTRLRLWRYAGKQLNSWELYTRTADGTHLTGSDCFAEPDEPFCLLDANADWTIDTDSLRVGIACTTAMTSCATGATLHEAWTGIHAAIVTVNDTTAPTASGAGGSLFAGGYLHGNVTASVGSASDSTGIQRLQVRVDGGRVVATGPDRPCDYTRRSPCADLTSPEALTFDSTSIGDGTWTARVGVLDTGDNFAAAGTQTITVDNNAPFAPTRTSPASVTVSAPTATILWAAPGGQVSPITSAHVTVCGPTGCHTRTQPAGNGAGSATVTLAAHGAYTAKVALQDSVGNLSTQRAATWTVDYPARTPALTAPAPMPTPAPTAAAPRLSLARPVVAPDRRTVAVHGRVAAGVKGAVVVTASARIGGRIRTVTRRAAIRNGRYQARLRLPSSAWRTARVVVRYPGSTTRRAATATHLARQRAQ